MDNHEEPCQRVFRDIICWEQVQRERTQFEAFGGVFLEQDFKPPSPPSQNDCDDSDVDSGAKV